ncbi:MAG: glycosyltransferase [Candidatus Diapherotrites archaeon]|nr:glycosyltransferase [Candidatus Diapherotrites archaeon]
MDFLSLVTDAYLLFSIPVLTLSLFFYFGVVFMATKKPKPAPKLKRGECPFVTVQIPVFNDPVVGDCIKACLNMDYPKDRFEIMVADDSTDPEVSKIVDNYAERYGRVKVIRRNHREGFKAGALNNAMNGSDGDILLLFDSDFVPPRDFLRRVVSHFEDPEVGVVQGRWKFLNIDENFISVFASLSLLVYQRLIYPIKNWVGVPLLSGSAVAIRRKAMEDAGGWTPNIKSEDTELGLRILCTGYRIIFDPDLFATCQVPFSAMTLVKQQMRWTYGTLEAFSMRFKDILKTPALSPFQKTFLLFIAFMLFINPLILLQLTAGTVLGFFNISPLGQLSILIPIITGGYLVAVVYTMSGEGHNKLIVKSIVATFLVGILVAFANTLAISKILLKKDMHWHVTTKHKGF